MRSDLQRIIDEIDAADRAAESLATRLTEAQFHWQPDEGRAWSVGQCLEHLAVVNVLYGGAVQQAIDRAKSRGWTGGEPIAPTWLGRKFIASQEPPVTRKFGAPAKVRPRSAISRDEILRAYYAAHVGVRALVRSASEIDVNRATFPNPFFPLLRVRVSTGLCVIPAHDRRHLWQAEQVTRAAGFPRELVSR
jgi:hypothetical protein